MNNIKALREKRGIKQNVLAWEAGISSPFLHDLENGNRNAKPETMQRIADALGCTVEELAGETGGETK